MKFVRSHPVLLLLSALAMLTMTQAALAQPGPGGGRVLRERPSGEQRQMPLRRDGAGSQDKDGESAAEGQDRRRLTPEERRQLRRDIRDAGRDIYRSERGPRRMHRREF